MTLLGLQALDAAWDQKEVAELLGVWVGTARDRKNLFDAGGDEALRKTAPSPSVAKRCKEVQRISVAEVRPVKFGITVFVVQAANTVVLLRSRRWLLLSNLASSHR